MSYPIHILSIHVYYKWLVINPQIARFQVAGSLLGPAHPDDLIIGGEIHMIHAIISHLKIGSKVLSTIDLIDHMF